MYSEYEKRFRESLQQKVDNLTPEALKLLKIFLIENRPLGYSGVKDLGFQDKSGRLDNAPVNCLKDSGLIITNQLPRGEKGDAGVTITSLRYVEAWEVNPEYRDVLREIVFKK